MLNFFNLPYNENGLEKTISSETISFHYGKHHRVYFDNLIKLISGTELENKDLVEIIKLSYNQADLVKVFNNSAQVFNHDFYWQSLTPDREEPSDFLKNKILADFPSWEDFVLELKNTALNQFASGWVWVVFSEGKIKITSTSNAVNPLVLNQTPLLCLDVWEHAYYIDYRNNRAQYLDEIIANLINWRFLESNIKKYS